MRNVRGLMKARLPVRVLKLLKQAGATAGRTSETLYVAGGFVRDLILGKPSLDIDLVVEGDGIALARTLAQEWDTAVKIHAPFGTAGLTLSGGFKVDVATARTESYEYPGALPTVQWSSIQQDLFRRDFTINTLAIRLNADRFGDLLDLYGGWRDLHDKTIRVLHHLSFIEDPTRIFRAVRFEQRFGFRLAKETLALMKESIKMNLLHRLSGSRLLNELILLCSEEKPRNGLRRLQDLDLLRFIHPSLPWSAKLDARLKSVEEALDWYRLLPVVRPPEAWIVYVLALMDVLPGEAVHETLKYLLIPKRQAEQIRAGRFRSGSLLHELAMQPTPRPAKTYHLLYGLSEEIVLFLMAKAKTDSVKHQISAYLTTYRYVRPYLTGKDLRALGMKPGPIYRSVLNRLRDARLNGRVVTEADEREMVKRLARGKQNRRPH
jgi:tRNA nucleotidyltransferase (CCA-adding enzyme)